MRASLFFGSLLLQLLHYSVAAGQTAGYFRNPLDIPMALSANFGEIRTNHFHTGLDLRTNGQTGYKVFAAAEGVVSRIKVSSGGFGHVLYISHPNGFMTVYAHLDRFNDALAAYVKQQQYARQSFEIELFPEPSKFRYKQGDLIAYSGNSGSSGGPHLHFEIRDATGETYPLNPAEFYPLKDTIAPKLVAAYLYDVQQNNAVPAKYMLKKTKTGYTLTEDSLIITPRMIGIALEAADYMNNTSNDYGIYEFSVQVDGKPVYRVRFDRLDFANGRYVNAYTDYRQLKSSGKKIQRLYRLPGDRNTIYHGVVDDGKISLDDGRFHRIEIKATDANQNSTLLSFHVKSNLKTIAEPALSSKATWFRYQQSNSFTSDSMKLSLPPGILYEDMEFLYVVKPGSPGRYSATHQVHEISTPLHDSYSISILPRSIPLNLQSKAVIVYDDGTGIKGTKSTRWDGAWLTARAREFGYFYVMLDTSPPRIVPVNIKQNQQLTAGSIRFTVTDNLSGIVSYKGLLNGKWVLMEYDPKNDRLQYTPGAELLPGEHVLKVTVTDDVGNEFTYSLKFKK